MFELKEIMRQRESNVFAEILNRLRHCNHTDDGVLKIKERITADDTAVDYPMNAPHLFIENKEVLTTCNIYNYKQKKRLFPK